MKSIASLIVIFQLLLTTAAWALEIISPTENQVFNAGDALSIVVKPSPGEEWIGVIYGIYKMDYNSLTGKYKVDIKIPSNLSGLQTLTVTGVDKFGNELEVKRSIFVKLPPNVVLQSISVGEDIMVLYKAPPDSTPEDKQRIELDQISVAGLYSDGVKRQITPAATGTTYVSSDENIVTVDSEGKLTSKGLGRAKITVRNGKYTAEVKVVVKPYKK